MKPGLYIESRERGEWKVHAIPVSAAHAEASAQAYADNYNCSTRIVEVTEKVVKKFKPNS